VSHEINLLPQNIFTDGYALQKAMVRAAEVGHAFVPNAMGTLALEALVDEAASLKLEEGDHITKPIYEGTKREITQLHERAYHAIGDTQVPVATRLTRALAVRIKQLRFRYPELGNWMATEAGYQLYRDDPERDYHISRHRDRRNDKLLSATVTVTGSAIVRMFDTLDDPDDYTDENVIQTDEFRTSPGSIMFLRAPGLHSGEQAIHEVRRPDSNRLILNLRMRDDVLPAPSETTNT
jgi:hypothetical protein